VYPSLHDPGAERDSCGIGFVADVRGRASRDVLDAALEGLKRVGHRGALAADGITGDGAGVLLPIPVPLVPGPWCGLAMVFLREDEARVRIEDACRAEGLGVVGWRSVPTDPRALGDGARTSAPLVDQLVIERPYGVGSDEAERRAYQARRRLAGDRGAYVCSLSFRTVTYKALCAAGQLASFYPDLNDPGFAVPFAIFHQRFSTNTEPSWERAQPFRLLCHNGEINAIDGNVNAMRARGLQALEPGGSDSATRSSCSFAAGATCATRPPC
jgi:glutamate synthase domain-containing protein 1